MTRSLRRAPAPTQVTAVDIDPFSIAAIDLNARANNVRIDVARDDLLDSDPPDVDVILAGDCWYEATFGCANQRVAAARAESGIRVLIGDPGRRYLAHERLARARDLRRPIDHRPRRPRAHNRHGL